MYPGYNFANLRHMEKLPLLTKALKIIKITLTFQRQARITFSLKILKCIDLEIIDQGWRC